MELVMTYAQTSHACMDALTIHCVRAYHLLGYVFVIPAYHCTTGDVAFHVGVWCVSLLFCR